MEQGDWENDADYPRAPLPAHERAWRHPSEIGAQQWTQSEPPLVVGRGLSIATGTVGAVLALGLLWLMVPHPGRGNDVAVEASTTSVRATALATAPTPSRELVETTDGTDAPTPGATVTTASVGSSLVASLPPTTADAVVPAPTMVLRAGSDADDAPPIAVALMPGHFVVTTAAAVRGREGFSVLLPWGETVTGAVVAVDVANGTAVLSITTDIDAVTLEASASDPSSGGFTVMTPDATSASLWVDDVGTQVGYADDAHAGEGSVVLDENGRLVGLCTRSAGGVQLVSVAALLDALATAATRETPAWLGVEAALNDDGTITVTQVLDGGPAQAAGVEIGDVIDAIDGIAVDDLETLRSVVSGHAAGQTVTLTVTKASAPVATSTTAVATSTPLTSTSTSTSLATTTSSTPAGSTTTNAATTTTVGTTTTLATSVAMDIVVTLSPPPGAP